MEEIITNIENYIKECGKVNLDSVDKDELFKVVDIYKDLKEVNNMNNGYRNYGRDAYGEYNEYSESFGRRGVDARYRGEDYMEGMRGSYRNYEEARNEYNRGNYGVKEDGLKDLEYMLHANHKLLKHVKEEATSPEEKEIVRKYFHKFSELMNV